MMMILFSAFCVLSAVALLLWLSKIDLETWLLPNTHVFSFFWLGILFHLSTDFSYIPPLDVILGIIAGGGSLYFIRAVSNWIAQDDTLGLGDVKLLGAAGAWLGPHFVMLALIVGAGAGIAHGLSYALWRYVRDGQWPPLTQLSIPAGPGFAVGIIVAAGWLLLDFPDRVATQIAMLFG